MPDPTLKPFQPAVLAREKMETQINYRNSTLDGTLSHPLSLSKNAIGSVADHNAD